MDFLAPGDSGLPGQVLRALLSSESEGKVSPLVVELLNCVHLHLFFYLAQISGHNCEHLVLNTVPLIFPVQLPFYFQGFTPKCLHGLDLQVRGSEHLSYLFYSLRLANVSVHP